MRLPNGYGSIYKLSGNRRKPFCVRKTVDWKDNGQPIYQYIGYYATRKEALQALVDYNENPFDLNAAKITFAEVYDKWTDQYFEKVSNSSINGTNAAYKLCESIYDMRFVDIKLVHLQKVVNDSKKNKPTLRKLKVMLGLMYEYAVVNEIVTPDKRDMVRYLYIDKGNPNAIDRSPFKSKEIDKLWKIKDSNEYVSIILIMIYTGVRIGELLDLKKEDVHLDERYIYIKSSKTASGIREVPIAEKIVPFIVSWMNRDCDYLICSNENEHFKYRNYTDSYWKPIMETLNMNHRPHDTRHTCVSLLAAAGVDSRIVKQIVGHKGIGVTEAVYTHMELPVKLEAINKI